MNNAMIVHIIDGGKKLCRNACSSLFTVGRARVQISTLAGFHDDVDLFLVHIDFLCFHNIGVIYEEERSNR